MASALLAQPLLRRLAGRRCGRLGRHGRLCSAALASPTAAAALQGAAAGSRRGISQDVGGGLSGGNAAGEVRKPFDGSADMSLRRRTEDRLWRFKQRIARNDLKPNQKLRSSRLNEDAVGEEQRKLLRALRQSTMALDWEGALMILHTIPQDPGPEWLPVYRSILNVCCKAMRLEEAKKFFWEQLPQRDVMSYNQMLTLFGQLQLEAEAEQLLRQMETECVHKNGMTYTAIMRAAAQTHRWETALSSLRELQGKPELEPTTAWSEAYLVAMTACARAGERTVVRSLLDECRKIGSLTENHFNALIVSCGSDPEAADGDLLEMKAMGFAPRLSDWSAVMGTTRDFQLQRDIYERAVAELPEGTRLEELWATLLRTVVTRKDQEGVRWVLNHMREQGLEPNSEAAQAVPPLRRALRGARNFLARSRELSASEQAGTRALETAGRPRDPEVGDPPLPPGWSAAVDPASGHEYFWQDANPAGTVTWTRPGLPELTSVSPVATAPSTLQHP